ncbi:uncharacterized protein LOC114722098 [Neltuma alba]|uniref:uncharacterized protein LOC114722098 n=1 Tax=Neltuma alba TaxID=207710 RepID=UPI0010A4BE76|nr:uncharacterized protein LOC114722098 [Prosopis alba]
MIRRSREEEDDDENESVGCELWIAKDREEGVFWCRETPSMFILSARLQGYKRNSIEIIKIKDEGGDQSSTNEEKPIQKLVIMGKVMGKNQEEILGFRKVYKIPNGVVPDQIKAKYSEEESVLKICMTKFVKQICGVHVEEVKEEEFGESSHKVIKELKVHDLSENPRVLEIGNTYGENDHREEDGKEEAQEVKNSEVEQNINVEDRIPENTGYENQEISNIHIVIQSLEESDNGVLGTEVDEEIIGGRKEKEIEDTKEEMVEEEDTRKEDYIIEVRKVKEIGEPKYEIEDRDVDVTAEGTEEEFEGMGNSNQMEEIGKEGFEEEAMETKVKELPKEPEEPLQEVKDETDIVVEMTEGEEQTDIEEPMLFRQVKDESCKERSQAKKKVEIFEETVDEEKGKTYDNERGDESGNQQSQGPKKQDSDANLLRRSQLESPSGPHNDNHEVIGQRESHGEHEVEVEVDDHGSDGLKDIQVEESEKEIANEQRDGVYVVIPKEIDHELQDIQVEAIREEEKAQEQRDEVNVEISHEVEERRGSQFKENGERKMLHGPLFIAGSAFVVFLVVLFIRHKRVEKR